MNRIILPLLLACSLLVPAVQSADANRYGTSKTTTGHETTGGTTAITELCRHQVGQCDGGVLRVRSAHEQQPVGELQISGQSPAVEGPDHARPGLKVSSHGKARN